MEMLNDSQNEMEFKDDSRSTISPISSFSSISSSSIDTSTTCERRQKIESNIQVYTSVRQVTKRELAPNFSIHNDYEHPEYKSHKNSIRNDDRQAVTLPKLDRSLGAAFCVFGISTVLGVGPYAASMSDDN
ncbi:hypothetical protein NPIL_644121 [Nephila pilipes]|uniref:Uncharacterized protein n=1 Tax=Nephila pilipes TaxID=299642 RepID=A0A8X6UU02_NEPPI|nr:hypothetical protein NPIL_644121 [Nephila pilipes]